MATSGSISNYSLTSETKDASSDGFLHWRKKKTAPPIAEICYQFKQSQFKEMLTDWIENKDGTPSSKKKVISKGLVDRTYVHYTGNFTFDMSQSSLNSLPPRICLQHVVALDISNNPDLQIDAIFFAKMPHLNYLILDSEQMKLLSGEDRNKLKHVTLGCVTRCV